MLRLWVGKGCVLVQRNAPVVFRPTLLTFLPLLGCLTLVAGCGSPSAPTTAPTASPPPTSPPPTSPTAKAPAPAPPTAPPLTQARMDALSSELRKLASTAPADDAAVYVRDMDTDLVAGIGADHRFLSASVIKLAVMGTAYSLWEEHPELKTSEAQTWMDLMITHSDNASTDHLVDLVGGVARVTEWCKERGWPHLIMRNKILQVPIRGANHINAREIGELLTAVERRKLVSETADAEMWELLKRQVKRNRIPAGVADLPGVEVGNKTGTIRKVLHDAAIIHTPTRRYVLVVLLSKHRSEWLGERFCQKVSRAVYDAFHSPEDGSAASGSAIGEREPTSDRGTPGQVTP